MLEPVQIFIFIIGSAVVIFGAYFATYMVARGSQKVYRGRSIRVLDRFSLTKDKSIVVLSVYNKVYVVAFTAGAATLLDCPNPQLVEEFAAKQASEAEPITGNIFNWVVRKTRFKKPSANEANIPFELYLQQDRENMDAVYAMMNNRKEKEEQNNAFADNADIEEDILK